MSDDGAHVDVRFWGFEPARLVLGAAPTMAAYGRLMGQGYDTFVIGPGQLVVQLRAEDSASELTEYLGELQAVLDDQPDSSIVTRVEHLDSRTVEVLLRRRL